MQQLRLTPIPTKTKFVPNRPSNTPPVIVEEFTDEGKRYYKADTGKIFDADIWDRNFKVSRQLVKKLGYKGKTPLHDGAGIKRSNDIKRFGKGR